MGWKKLLGAMVADQSPRSYTYADAASVLKQLGFDTDSQGGSHRKWQRMVDDPQSPSGKRTVTVGLVERGNGTLKPKYISTMLDTLRANNLLPEGVE